ELARPRVGIVTMIGSVHLEYFDSAAGLARAKAELITALPPDGLALLNAEDDWFGLLRDLSPAPVIGFGLEAGDFRAEAWRPLRAGGSILSVDGVQVRIGLAGRHQARNALGPWRRAATAVSRSQRQPARSTAFASDSDWRSSALAAATRWSTIPTMPAPSP